jgi:hypothetical protein
VFVSKAHAGQQTEDEATKQLVCFLVVGFRSFIAFAQPVSPRQLL